MKIVFILFFSISSAFCLDVDIIKLLDAIGVKYSYHSSKVLKVTDGDTIYVSIYGKRKSLRLIGADTPEVGGSKLPKDAKKCGVSKEYMKRVGKLSSEYTKAHIKKGDIVKFIVFGFDRYQRPVSYLLNHHSVKLIKDGFAVAYDSPQLPFVINSAFSALEKYAKVNKKGLWNDFGDIMECIKK
jgi:endonuclease YncB( thermonuclease family)